MPVTGPQSSRVVLPLPDRSPAERPRGGGVFKQILRTAAKVAAAAIPGVGPIVGAAVDGVGRRRAPLLDSFGGSSETLQYLELQREIQHEVRAFEATSNVLKVRHEATMAAIRNMRS